MSSLLVQFCNLVTTSWESPFVFLLCHLCGHKVRVIVRGSIFCLSGRAACVKRWAALSGSSPITQAFKKRRLYQQTVTETIVYKSKFNHLVPSKHPWNFDYPLNVRHLNNSYGQTDFEGSPCLSMKKCGATRRYWNKLININRSKGKKTACFKHLAEKKNN